MKRSAHLACGPGEIDRSGAGPVDRKTFGLEPRGGRLNILRSQAELLLELFGRKPLVIVRRLGVLLIASEIVELLLLFTREGAAEAACAPWGNCRQPPRDRFGRWLPGVCCREAQPGDSGPPAV